MEKIKLTLILITCLISSTTFSQSVDWIWAKNAGGNAFDQGKYIVSDNDGNLLIAGLFKNTAQFGSFSLTASGIYHDVFIAKYDDNGNTLWAVSFGGASSEDVNGLALDSDQNIYISGTYSNTLIVGSSSFVSTGSSDIYLVKLDKSGNIVWAKSSGSKMQDRNCGVAVDGYSIYIGGSFGSTFYADSDSTISAGQGDLFIQKIDTAGNLDWLISAGGKGSDFPKGIAASSDMVFISGQFYDTCYFNNISVIGQASTDIFNAAYSSDGNIKWAKSALGEYGNYPNAMCSDKHGNTYLTGCFGKTLTFGNTTITSNGLVDVFIAKYDSSGSCIWAKREGGASYDQGIGISADNNGSLVITGFFRDNMSIGSSSLNSYGGNDAYLAEYSDAGSFRWAKNAGGSNWDFGFGICKYDNFVYAIGYFATSANFGTIKLNAPGSDEDIYICKIGVPPPPSVIITKHPQSKTICKGDSTFFNVVAKGNNLSYQWKYNGSEISAAIDSFLLLNGISTSEAGSYSCTISDSGYAVTSNPGILTVGGEPVITKQPDNKNVNKGQKVTIRIIATGAGSYQWQKDGIDISGETTNTLIFTSIQVSDEGKYRCVLIGGCGSIISDESTVSVSTAGISNHINAILTIAPNPSCGIIMLTPQNLDDEITVEIFDTKGQKVISEIVYGNNQRLDLSHLNKGIYIILANSTGNSFSGKIVLR